MGYIMNQSGHYSDRLAAKYTNKSHTQKQAARNNRSQSQTKKASFAVTTIQLG